MRIIWKFACVFQGLSCFPLMSFSIRYTPDARAAAGMGLGLVLLIDWA